MWMWERGDVMVPGVSGASLIQKSPSDVRTFLGAFENATSGLGGQQNFIYQSDDTTIGAEVWVTG
jgi:hypothetical protein